MGKKLNREEKTMMKLLINHRIERLKIGELIIEKKNCEGSECNTGDIRLREREREKKKKEENTWRKRERVLKRYREKKSW